MNNLCTLVGEAKFKISIDNPSEFPIHEYEYALFDCCFKNDINLNPEAHISLTKIGNMISKKKNTFNEDEFNAFTLGKISELLSSTSAILKMKNEIRIDDMAKRDQELINLILIIGKNDYVFHKDLAEELGKTPNNLSNYFTRNSLWQRYISVDVNPFKKNSILYYLNVNGQTLFDELFYCEAEMPFEQVFKNWQERYLIMGGIKNGKVRNTKEDSRLERINIKQGTIF